MIVSTFKHGSPSATDAENKAHHINIVKKVKTGVTISIHHDHKEDARHKASSFFQDQKTYFPFKESSTLKKKVKMKIWV